MPAKKNNNKQQQSVTEATAAAPAAASSSSSSTQQKQSSGRLAAVAASMGSQQSQDEINFKIPKASPIANYKEEELTDRQKFLLSKLAKMKLYTPKELPPPRLNRNRGWFKVLLEKYNIETALYMLEPWERWLLNIFLVLFVVLLGYWFAWLWDASLELYREYAVPAVGLLIKQIKEAQK